MMYKLFIRPIFFLFDPEKIHHFTSLFIRMLFKIPGFSLIFRSLYQITDTRLERNIFGLKFKNPVGLAAGFDKNATLYNELANFGFGFVEIGTVTPKRQVGNPKKRLFRLQNECGIINRMGFNNEGLQAAIEQLKKNKGKIIIGGNIGKNTTTNPEDYTADYLECFRGLYTFVDYFVVNVSCPNVSSHAKLEDADYLEELLTEIQKVNKELSLKNQKDSFKPVLLKIAPDLNNRQLDEIIQLVASTQIDGVIAANTSTNRSNLKTTKNRLEKIGNGGVSGQPIKDRSTKVIEYLATHSNKAFPIIGVGGIHSVSDALEKIRVGADLVQIYTGFIYEGPQLIKQINRAILQANTKVAL